MFNEKMNEMVDRFNARGDTAAAVSDGFFLVTTSRTMFNRFRDEAMKAGWDWEFCKKVAVGNKNGLACKFLFVKQV